MAKKAKKAKKAAKAKKVAKAKKAVKPKAGKPGVTVPIQSVVQFVKMLMNEDHADTFEAEAKASNALVSLDSKSAKFIKKFLADNHHLRPMMRAAVRDPCPGNPFEC